MTVTEIMSYFNEKINVKIDVSVPNNILERLKNNMQKQFLQKMLTRIVQYGNYLILIVHDA